MYQHEIQIRVRYSETDQMGTVYHGHYATYLEVARVEALRALGVRYADLEAHHGILLPVVNMHLRFLRPARYDDMLTLRTSVPVMPVDSITFQTEILLETGEVATAARIGLCFLRTEDRKRIELPEFIRDKLLPYFEKE
jgi:acyl-CoA thioester hydrolase